MVTSAGLLLHRVDERGLVVFLAHMGGPFWRRRERSWSVPKGIVEPGEEALAAARREFAEEIGASPPTGATLDLGTFRQSAKDVRVFAVAVTDATVAFVRSNTVRVELPRGSGRYVEVPEVDRAGWLPIDEARGLVVAGQVAALDALRAALSG